MGTEQQDGLVQFKFPLRNIWNLCQVGTAYNLLIATKVVLVHPFSLYVPV
jgi:hypothetical protein